MEQTSQVLIRKIETNIGMFHVNKLSQGPTEAGWNDALYNAYCFNLIIERIDKMDLDKHSVTFLMLAEVVASNPPLVHFINLVNHGVVLSLFLTIVGQNPSATPILYPPLLHGGCLSSAFVTIHFFRPPPLLLLSIRPMTWYPYSRLCLV